MDFNILENEIVESYTLNDIYEEIENFAEMTSDLVEIIRIGNLLNDANSYLTSLNN